MGGRQTNLSRKMSNVKAPGESRPRGDSDRAGAGKSNNTNMIIAASVGGLLVIGVVAFAMMGGKSDKGGKVDHSESSEKKKKPASTGGSAKSSMGDSKSSSGSSNPFTAPPAVAAGTFQPGARGMVDATSVDTKLVRDEGLKREYESLITGGKSSDIVAQDHRWLLVAFDGMLNDNEAVARGSMDVVHQIIVKRGFAKDVQQYTRLAAAANIMNFESAAARAEEYGYWSRWWYTRSSQDMVAKWATDSGSTFNPQPAAKAVSAPSGAGEWDEIMKGLKGGGGFDAPTSPEYPYFQHVKGMGKGAYPKLVGYIENEDPAVGRAAVAVLNALTGRDTKLPNDSTKTAIKAEWEAWLKTQ